MKGARKGVSGKLGFEQRFESKRDGVMQTSRERVCVPNSRLQAPSLVSLARAA